MAYVTEKTYTQTTTGNRDFSVTFPFMQTADLRVQLGGVTQSLNTHYTIVQSGANTVINFNTAPADNATIRIFRDTDIDDIKRSYSAGNSIRATDLNENNKQLLYAAQEFGTLKEDNSVSFTLGNKGDIQVNSSSDWVIQNNSIEQAHLVDDSVGNNEIIDGSITGGKLASLAISSAQLATNAVTTAKIDTDAVTIDKIADNAVDTAQIANNAVEPPKINQTAASGYGFNPVGTVIWYAASNAPTGYLKCNGDNIPNGSGTVQNISADFSALHALIGGTLPDLRGEFIRGFDDGRGADSNRQIRSTQEDLVENHQHTATTGTTGSHTHTSDISAGGHTHKLNVRGSQSSHQDPYVQTLFYDGEDGNTGVVDGQWISGGSAPSKSDDIFVGSSAYNSSTYQNVDSDYGVPDGTHTHTLSVNAANSTHSHPISVSNNTGGGAETRPRNVALLACIKY